MTDHHVPFANVPGQTYRVLGPPGTGKTTWLVRQAERAAEEYGPLAVRVVSMTRAAAREFSRRHSPVPSENVTTIHALAYRAIGRPKILVSADIASWNDGPGAGRWEISSVDRDTTDGTPLGTSDGDILLSKLDLLRARMEQPKQGSELALFAHAYREWKESIGKVDFTDFLERALLEVQVAPGMPEVLFVDEAQDLSALELALIEQWGARCKVVVLVGDPDQSIYSWRGADRDVLLGAAPFAVLAQSHRVPMAVHERALALIRRSSTWSGANYHPRNAPGRYSVIPRSPEQFADAVEALLSSEAPPEGGHIQVMLLASCGYMLAPFVSELRRRAIPYHNPFRPEWNPLARGNENRTTVVDRLAAFAALRCPKDFVLAIEPLRSARNGGPIMGLREQALSLPEDASPHELSAWAARTISPSALPFFDRAPHEPVSNEALSWWISEMKQGGAKSASYAVECAQARGIEEVLRPRLAIGTIHSVKGGEAQHVFLASGLSPKGRKQRLVSGWDGEDAIYRQFYVGATRARESLTVLAPVGAGLSMSEVEV